MTLRRLLTKYGLGKMPFGREVPIEELFETDALKAARQQMKAAVEGRSCAVVTGEPGTGKTFVVRAVEAALPQGRYNVTYVHNSTVNCRDFYRQLAVAMGLEPKATPSALFRLVTSHIESLSTEHKVRPLVILDEAHLLPVTVLGHLHILLNYQRDSRSCLSLVLVGLPELRGLLRRQALASLAARLPMRVNLHALSAEEVAAYVRHRLSVAGRTAELFAEDALLLLAEATGGMMRRIDVVAHEALVVGASKRSTLIDGSVMKEAIDGCAEALG